MPRDRFDDRAVLVTGAGSGIGRETALAFAARGARLFICDLDEEKLTDAAQAARRFGGEVHAHVVDVSRREAMHGFAESVHRHADAIDVLVNNAGVGLGGGFLDTSLDDWEWLISINLWGVIHGCHYFVPKMVTRARGGHVVNVASAAGYLAPSDLCAYGTTKYAVVGLSEALREELREHGISVATICPGVINTPITRSSRLRGTRGPSREELVQIYEKRGYGPEKVAAAIVEAVIKRRGMVPVTPEAWVGYTLKRVIPETLPKLVSRLMAARAGANKKKGTADMYEVEFSEDIAAGADRVWDVLTAFREYDEWNPIITRMRATLSVNTPLSFIIAIGGRELKIRAEMVKVEPGREIRWRGPTGFLARIFHGEHYLRVEALPGGKSRLIHGERFGGFSVPLLWPKVKKDVEKAYPEMNRAVRARAESKPEDRRAAASA